MWVFAYGSLLWNPEFTPVETHLARLSGYHRSFSMLSIHHRGTPEVPGLVLALDAAPGASCTGLALRVADAEAAEVHEMLRERELVSAAYVERHVSLRLDDGRRIEALAYVIDPRHEQYCDFPLEQQAQMIARAHGGRGPNAEYLNNTLAHFDELGIQDTDMDWLRRRVEQITGG